MPLRIGNRNFIECLQDEERGINLQAYTVEYLIVGGGGQGGPTNTSPAPSPTGGGGAGGFITGSYLVKSPTRYYITVGKGGWGSPSEATLSGNNGATSSIFDFVALGGGGGA
ncbi:MAG: glycine-rich domain-containing protein, partial [Flammeovirgaceae bacterium]